MCEEKQQQVKGVLGNYLIRLLTLAALAAIIYLIVRYIDAENIGKVKSVVLALFGLGLVVFVHELGHFTLAKMVDIHVKAFSLFMGPILLGIRRTEKGFVFRILPSLFPKQGSEDGLLSFTVGKPGRAGETEYRICLIPFGGFVSMLGQEDVGAAEKDDNPRSFMNKSVGARMKVISAGVIFNVIFAVLIFIIVFLTGIDFPAPVVGGLRPDSPAQIAGLQPGDEIIKIDGKSDIEFVDIGSAAALSAGGQKIHLTVRRLDGTTKEFSIASDVPADKNTDMRIFGILPTQRLTVANVKDPNKLYENTGLLGGDTIVAVDGEKVKHGWEFDNLIETALTRNVTLIARRSEANSAKTEQVQSKPIPLEMLSSNDNFKTGYKLNHICSMVPRLKIVKVLPARQTSVSKGLLSSLKKLFSDPNRPQQTVPSLKVGDIITAVADIRNPTYQELREITIKYENKELPITVLRHQAGGKYRTETITVTPLKPIESTRVEIGISIVFDAEHPVVAATIATETALGALDIPRGATITAVNGQTVSDFYDVIAVIRKNTGRQILLEYHFDAEKTGRVLFDVPNEGNFITAKTTLAASVPFKLLTRTYKATGPINAVAMGCRRTFKWICSSYRTIRALVAGIVSPKNLMGPVGIISMGSAVIADEPFINSLYLLALVNALIAVFNFLPLPVFDGGHMVLLIIEKIKGSALNYRVQTIINYVGLAFILALALYITRMDIIRAFFQ